MYKVGDSVVYIGVNSSYETNGKEYLLNSISAFNSIYCIDGDDNGSYPILETEYIPLDLYNKLLDEGKFFKRGDVVHYVGENDGIFRYGERYSIGDVSYDEVLKTVILTFPSSKSEEFMFYARKYDLFYGVKEYRDVVINDILNN